MGTFGSMISPCGSIHGGTFDFPDLGRARDSRKRCGSRCATPRGASHGAFVFRRDAHGGWLDLATLPPRSEPDALSSSRFHPLRLARRCAAPVSLGGARHGRDVVIRLLPQTSFVGTSPRKHRPREPLLPRGRATEPRTRDEARCGVPGRSETPGLRDVRALLKERVVARRCERARMTSRGRCDPRRGIRRVSAIESSPARTCIDTLRRRFIGGDPGWSRDAAMNRPRLARLRGPAKGNDTCANRGCLGSSFACARGGIAPQLHCRWAAASP